METVKRPRWKRAIPAVSALIAGGVITGAAVWQLRPTPAAPITRSAMILPEGESFTNAGGQLVAISPDGTQMVYVANQRLYHRTLSELDSRPIPGTETWSGVLNPVFSPDGRSVVFYANSDKTLKKIAVGGGASVTLCAVDPPFGISWDENGILIGQGNNGIVRVSENGGKPEVVIKAETGTLELADGPELLPGRDTLLYSVAMRGDGTWDKGKIFLQSLRPGSARKLLIDGGGAARYLPTGHIVYAYQGTLFAVPFDLKRLQTTGGPVPVVEGVRRALNGTGTAQFSFSKTGALIYVTGPVSSINTDRGLALLDLKGGVEQLKTPPKAYAFPRVSPDGKQAAVSTDDKDVQVWIIDLSGNTAPRQLTLGGANRYPVWSVDGTRVAFQSDREGDPGIWWQKADGTGMAERLTKAEAGTGHIPDSWSPDGNNLTYTIAKGSELAQWIFSISDKKSMLFAEKAGRASFSPDGHWLAYQSSETGANRQQPSDEVFVQPFPPTGAKYPIVRGGQPFWSPDGRQLIYTASNRQTGAIRITTNPSFAFGQTEILPGGTHGLFTRNASSAPRTLDFTRDGKYLLGASVQAAPGTGIDQINVVLNWFEELKQRVPVR